MTGRIWTEDQKSRVSAALKGRDKSPETREKLRKANLGKVSPQRGVPRSPEVRAKISASKIGNRVSMETKRRISNTLRGQGFSLDPKGYVVLSGQHGHPLANYRGRLREHRKVLYDHIGSGEHCCYWCGVQVNWEDGSLATDHLDWDVSNNDLSNLVPTCYPCNSSRKNPQHGRWVPYIREDGTKTEDPIKKTIT